MFMRKWLALPAGAKESIPHTPFKEIPNPNPNGKGQGQGQDARSFRRLPSSPATPPNCAGRARRLAT